MFQLSPGDNQVHVVWPESFHCSLVPRNVTSRNRRHSACLPGDLNECCWQIAQMWAASCGIGFCSGPQIVLCACLLMMLSFYEGWIEWEKSCIGLSKSIYGLVDPAGNQSFSFLSVSTEKHRLLASFPLKSIIHVEGKLRTCVAAWRFLVCALVMYDSHGAWVEKNPRFWVQTSFFPPNWFPCR